MASYAENASIWWRHHVNKEEWVWPMWCQLQLLWNLISLYYRISIPLPYSWSLQNCFYVHPIIVTSRARHGVSNHQHVDCLFNSLSKLKAKKTSKLYITSLCEGNLWLPWQRTYNAEKRSHVMTSSGTNSCRGNASIICIWYLRIALDDMP